MIVRLLVAAALLAGPAMAQDSKQSQDTESSGPPKRVRSILLYGQEERPKPQCVEEIFVCASPG